jgi:dUTP pyrophosphatase
MLGNNMRCRGFEIVEDAFRKHPNVDIQLPKRGTSRAMAYDFFSPIEVELQPGEKMLIFTDIKAYMQDGEALILNPRSSMGKLDLTFANTQGWIDADYYGNESNDGNIGIYLKNNGKEVVKINIGDRIGQGAFIPFLVADNGNTKELRKGGYGSTGR